MSTITILIHSCLCVVVFCLHCTIFVYYSKENATLIASRAELNCELVASWTVSVGDLDQALHLWRYTGGFSSVDKTKIILGSDEVRLSCNSEHFNHHIYGFSML